MGIEGESLDKSHKSWKDVDGSGASDSGTPAMDDATSSDAGSSSESGGSPQPAKPGGGVNPATIVLVGLMLATIAGAAVLANRGSKNTSPEAEEIVFEPEVVELEKGTALLTASYSTVDVDFFDTYGEDEIQLTIIENTDHENFYNVDGKKSSVQKVTTYGFDRGDHCPINVEHLVEYIVSGSFSSAACRFFITVTLKPSKSDMVSNACSFDPPGGVSHFYAAPSTAEMQFTYMLEQKKSESFTFYLTDVKLPSGVNCPSFVR
jgi:hypothetical protein